MAPEIDRWSMLAPVSRISDLIAMESRAAEEADFTAVLHFTFNLSRDLIDFHAPDCGVCRDEGCCCDCGLHDAIFASIRPQTKVETCGDGRLCVECRETKPAGRSEGRHQGCHDRLVTEWRDTGTWANKPVGD